MPPAPMLRQVSHRRKHVQRRRWILWFPLMLLGSALTVWEITQWEPSPLLVLLGVLCMIPWVADTPC